MQLLSCHKGQLLTAKIAEWDGAHAKTKSSFATGLDALDQLLPGGAFARGVIHELLALPEHPFPLFAALVLARAAACDERLGEWANGRVGAGVDDAMRLPSQSLSPSHPLAPSPTRAIVWSDPLGTLYPPAVAAMGVPLDRLYILRPTSIADENWAITECLRCRGVSAVVAAPRKLSRIEARRFQLAAERGGGVGLLLRPYDRTSNVYAAATRWLVAPHPGERTVQKWKLQLIHGHGGRIGQSIILEHHRDVRDQTHPVRATVQLADRSVSEAARTG